MAEARQPATGRWRYAALFVGLAALWLFLRLLPLSTVPTSWPGPDLMLCLTLAWVLRRPDYVPALLVAAVFLLEDFLLMRPPGLWALIVLLGTEFLRARHVQMRELGLFTEWLVVALLITAMVLVNRLVLAVTVVPQPDLGLVALHMVATILAYPLVVGLCFVAFRLRKPTTGEVDSRGRRL